MNPDVLTIPTEWQKHGDVWRRAVALVQVGEGLPEIARIVVVEMPGDMDPSVVKVFTLTPFPVGRAQMTARTQDPQGASRPKEERMTPRPTLGPNRHIPTIFQARRDGSFRWICSCGAESDYHKGRRAAENDHDEHVTSLARIDR